MTTLPLIVVVECVRAISDHCCAKKTCPKNFTTKNLDFSELVFGLPACLPVLSGVKHVNCLSMQQTWDDFPGLTMTRLSGLVTLHSVLANLLPQQSIKLAKIIIINIIILCLTTHLLL